MKKKESTGLSFDVYLPGHFMQMIQSSMQKLTSKEIVNKGANRLCFGFDKMGSFDVYFIALPRPASLSFDPCVV